MAESVHARLRHTGRAKFESLLDGNIRRTTSLWNWQRKGEELAKQMVLLSVPVDNRDYVYQCPLF